MFKIEISGIPEIALEKSTAKEIVTMADDWIVLTTQGRGQGLEVGVQVGISDRDAAERLKTAIVMLNSLINASSKMFGMERECLLELLELMPESSRTSKSLLN